MRVKIFCNNSDIKLQDEINEWLEDNPAVNVAYIAQSESVVNELTWITISLFYL